ncbi:MAG: 3-isopropylmalate dehydratase small subunit [Candidatus Methanomethylicia archaeon]
MSQLIFKGRAWKFGDNIDTDVITPGKYLILPIDELKNYALEPIDPEFSRKVKPGDIIVAGRNFGCGSSREQAPAALKALGISVVIAESFARIFFRNAISLGLPVVICEEISKRVSNGDLLEVNLEIGEIRNLNTGQIFKTKTLSRQMIEILKAGGVIPLLKGKLLTR